LGSDTDPKGSPKGAQEIPECLYGDDRVGEGFLFRYGLL